MVKNSRFYIFIFVALKSCFAISAAIDVKFEDLKSLIEKQNPNIRSAQLELEASKHRTGHLLRSFLPQIEVQAGQESFKTGENPNEIQPTFGAELKINIFKGGRDKIESEIRELEQERKAVLFQKTLADELEEVRKLYWEILFSQEKMSVLKDAITINSQNLKSAERRIRSGVATESDRVEFEMKAVELNREYLHAELIRNNRVRDFSILMNFEVSQKLNFSQKLEHNHNFEMNLRHEAKDHEFRYKNEQILAQQNELNSISHKRSLWPEVEVFAGYNQYNQRIESAGPDSISDMRKESVLGVRLKMEFGNVLNSLNEAKAKSLEAHAELKRVEFKKQQVEFHMENELSELRFLHDQIHDAEENIGRAEKYYKLTQSEYSRGVKNSPDVLGATEKLIDNRIKMLEIVKEFQIAKVHVLSKIGK